MHLWILMTLLSVWMLVCSFLFPPLPFSTLGLPPKRPNRHIRRFCPRDASPGALRLLPGRDFRGRPTVLGGGPVWGRWGRWWWAGGRLFYGKNDAKKHGFYEHLSGDLKKFCLMLYFWYSCTNSFVYCLLVWCFETDRTGRHDASDATVSMIISLHHF